MRVLSFITVFLLLFAVPARADIFVWEDPESGLSLSFPDTWSVLNNMEPDDVITIKAPSASDEAVCRIKVRDDGRFLIYPPRYDSAAQRTAYSVDFWKSYLRGRYDNVIIHRVRDKAGLGRGHASYMLASFVTPGEYASLKSAIGFAALYNDKAYVVECSSFAGAFNNWLQLFQSIVGSVNFKKAHHEMVTGHYRNFMED
jgi:hypothetical protein